MAKFRVFTLKRCMYWYGTYTRYIHTTSSRAREESKEKGDKAAAFILAVSARVIIAA